MDDAARRARNDLELRECYTVFRERVAAALLAVERAGFRPRIQEGWRSPEDQLEAYNSGRSKRLFSLHNVTGKDGSFEALAVDILDDDSPLNPSTRYLLTLAMASHSNQLKTGILRGLPERLARGVREAIETGRPETPVKVGWEPTHLQVVGINASAAKKGERPV